MKTIKLNQKTIVINLQKSTDTNYEGDIVQMDTDIYTLIRLLENEGCKDIHVLLRTNTLPYDIDRQLAFATATGVSIKIVADNPDTVADIPALSNLSTIQYSKLSNKHTIYKYLKPFMAEFKAEQKFLNDAKERAWEYANEQNQKLHITKEVKDFVETWAPAYGLPIPRWEEVQTDYTDYSPKKYNTLYKEWKEENLSDTEINQRIGSWELKEKQRKRPTPYADIVRIVHSLQFFRRNDIPMDDNYTLCPICGKPFRTNRMGITHLQEDAVCPSCTPIYKGVVVQDAPELLAQYKIILEQTGVVADVLVDMDCVSFQDWLSVQASV